MDSRPVRLILAVALSAGMLFSAIPAAAEPAEHHNQTQRYLPWVPYAEVISDPRGFPDSGPYYGLITVQNLENEPVKLEFHPTFLYGGGGAFASPEVILEAHGSTTLSPTTVAFELIPQSSGVWTNARKVSDDSPARIAAVMRQVSPTMPSPPSSTSGAHITVSGYTALSYAGVASTPRIIPIAQTNSNWNTLIRLTNFETAENAFVTVTLRQHGGGQWTQLPGITIPSGQTHTLNMYDLVPQGWIGSVNISSASHVGAIAERVKNETNMLLLNTSRSQAQSSTVQVAPLVFRNWHHWNTGIAVVNHGFQQNELTVTFLSPEGSQVHQESLSLGDRQMDFIYLPAGDGEPFMGSALIEGTLPFTAVVDEVKYFGNDLDTGHAMSYSADYLLAEPGHALAFPLFRRGNPQTGGGDTSGIQIFNIVGEADVQILVYDQSGNLAMPPESFTLSTHHGHTFYSMNLDALPVGFTGSVVVRNRATGGQWSSIAAVTNLVNYDVQYDGSASFNARRFESPEPVPLPPVIISP
jgi:hypothetical protein